MNGELLQKVNEKIDDENRVVFFKLSQDQWFRMRTTPVVINETYETIPILDTVTENEILTKLLSSGLVDSLNQIKALFVINNGEIVSTETLTLDVHEIATDGYQIIPFVYKYDTETWETDGGEGNLLKVISNYVNGTFTLSEALAFKVMDPEYLADNGIFNFGDEDAGDETAQNDWDFGSEEDGVDPDSVATRDYDFNNL